MERHNSIEFLFTFFDNIIIYKVGFILLIFLINQDKLSFKNSDLILINSIWTFSNFYSVIDLDFSKNIFFLISY
jgi:hypothetical protein